MALTVASCGSDDAGDGQLSLLRAEMADVATDANAMLAYCITDNGKRVVFSMPKKAAWAQTPDSLYRAMVWMSGEANTSNAELLNASYALTLVAQKHDINKLWQSKCDPITLTSCWWAADKRHINLELTVLTDNNAKESHVLGLVEDSVRTASDGISSHYCHLCHDRSGIPAYYSTTFYASIPVEESHRNDRYVLTLTTPKGKTTVTPQ